MCGKNGDLRNFKDFKKIAAVWETLFKWAVKMEIPDGSLGQDGRVNEKGYIL